MYNGPCKPCFHNDILLATRMCFLWKNYDSIYGTKKLHASPISILSYGNGRWWRIAKK